MTGIPAVGGWRFHPAGVLGVAAIGRQVSEIVVYAVRKQGLPSLL